MDADAANTCPFCHQPVGQNGTTIFECYNCVARWCEACELVRLDNSECLFCGRIRWKNQADDDCGTSGPCENCW